MSDRPRRIGVVTVSRSDYGIYRPVLRALQADPELELQLIVGGAHWLPEYGRTVDVIVADGFSVDARVEFPTGGDSPQDIATSLSAAVARFASHYACSAPDILLVLGDRYEMMAAALAALPFVIPVAHLHGGEITHGAIDDALRHCMTKLSHLHFVAAEAYATRVVQLGEAPWRVKVTGAPSLDFLTSFQALPEEELAPHIGGLDVRNTLLVTFHPATLQYEQTGAHCAELLAALDDCDFDLLFTYPGADTGGQVIVDALQRFCRGRSRTYLTANLGTECYFTVMHHCRAMVGNSSSGIIEAASLSLPVVNIGARQAGRLRNPNVIDVACDREQIAQAIQRATSAAFRSSFECGGNLYGDGKAAGRIAQHLKDAPLGPGLVEKHFYDLPGASQ